ncbi:MAG: hypothetical protein K2O91_20835 [Lachnospiraceae bacterium]|nr:hypothetical protein [Lachnospiraceae bacterium]
MGEVDYYDYIGYRRNKAFIMLRDYVVIPENNLLNVLRNEEIVLTGNIYLCNYLLEYLKQNQILIKGYLNISSHDSELIQLQEIDIEYMDDEIECLIVAPEFFDPERFHSTEEMG